MSARRSTRNRLSAGGEADPAAADATGNVNAEPRRPIITPRNSTQAEEAEKPKETPYAALRQLANVMDGPATPAGRAASNEAPSTRRPGRTPAPAVRTPGASALRPGSAKRPAISTPHGIAAARGVETRRAAVNTPGRDRRRSGRQQRETPRGLLRQLSRVLAPETQPIESSPAEAESTATERRLTTFTQLDDLDEGPEIQRPRLSLPPEEYAEDDSLLEEPPNQTELPEDENTTQHSIEFPRRMAVEQSQFPRTSFGTIRMSDRFGDGGMNELGMGDLQGEVPDSSFIGQGGDDSFPDMDDDQDITIPDERTETIRGAFLGQGRSGRVSLASRTSDIRAPDAANDDTETTFVMAVPQRDRSSGIRDRSSGIRAPEVDEASEHDSIEEDEDEDEENEDEEGEDVNSDVDGDVDGDVEMEDASVLVSETGQTSANQRSAARAPAPIGKETPAKAVRRRPKEKVVKLSKHGIEYKSLPAGVVKKMATTFAKTSGSGKTKISKDMLEAIMQASDWFFEQVSADLGVYAEHAGRKTIDESDVTTLLQRYIHS